MLRKIKLAMAGAAAFLALFVGLYFHGLVHKSRMITAAIDGCAKGIERNVSASALLRSQRGEFCNCVVFQLYKDDWALGFMPLFASSAHKPRLSEPMMEQPVVKTCAAHLGVATAR
ncbi:MAG: hypothetical protein MRY74_08435 [Neomegalonema sp.]|nr:hypothetical protein [Neomegalonema sp.]